MPSDCYRVYIEYTCAKFGVDSSSSFPVRAHTDRQTDATKRSTDAGGFASVDNDGQNLSAPVTLSRQFSLSHQSHSTNV